MKGVRDETIKKTKLILKSYSKAQFGLLLAGILLGVALGLLPVDYTADHVGSVLTTLTIVQASILGIVFSVSILGVQLIADRYSPRMMRLVTSDPVFIGTLALFSISTIFDLLLVLSLSSISPKVAIGGVAVAGGFAGAFGIGLKRSVDTILERSTPEGLLEAYANDITVDDYREKVRESKNSPNQHPLHDLHELSMAALSRHEWSTAQNGIEYTATISSRIIEAEFDRGNLTSGEDDLTRNYFRVPLTEHLPRTAHRAIETQEDDLVRESLSAIEMIGKTGIENDLPSITTDCASGLNSVFRETPSGTEGQVLRTKCLDAYRELLNELFERPAPNELITVLSLYNSQIRIWLRSDHEQWEYETHLGVFYQHCIPDGLAVYLDSTEEVFESVDVDWNSQFTPDDQPNAVHFIFSLLRYTFEINEYIFRYHDRNDEWPLLVTSFRDGLLKMCENSSEGPTGLTQLLVRYYVNTVYVASRLDSRDITSSWARFLVHSEDEFGGKTVVDQALKTSTTEGLIHRYQSFVGRLDRQRESQSTAKQLYQTVRGDTIEYSEWLMEFQKAVDTNREELKN